MAQKKGKGEKSTSNDAAIDGTALILDYLPSRPYSAIDISTNLHNKVNKAYAVKTLRELHQKKEIECRTAGKQIVYHALQEISDEASPEILESMDENIKNLQGRVTGFKESEKKMQTELTKLCATPLLSDLRCEIGSLEEENQSLSTRLVEVQHDGSENNSPEEREKTKKDWKLWQKHARTRGQISRELWEKCSELLPKNMTREDLWEYLGLEGSPMDQIANKGHNGFQ